MRHWSRVHGIEVQNLASMHFRPVLLALKVSGVIFWSAILAHFHQALFRAGSLTKWLAISILTHAFSCGCGLRHCPLPNVTRDTGVILFWKLFNLLLPFNYIQIHCFCSSTPHPICLSSYTITLFIYPNAQFFVFGSFLRAVRYEIILFDRRSFTGCVRQRLERPVADSILAAWLSTWLLQRAIRALLTGLRRTFM